LEKLSSESIESALSNLDGWFLNEGQLCVLYQLNSFMDAISFVNLVSDKSEHLNHHPKIIIDFNKIEFNLITHDIGGLSKLDIQLAKFINETYNELFISEH
tara:strand:+ start:616 stop:918 length:303 start_codon:yes stop_codon:yes gene_type:complete